MIYCKHYWIWEAVWHSDQSDVISDGKIQKNSRRTTNTTNVETCSQEDLTVISASAMTSSKNKNIKAKSTETGKDRRVIKLGDLIIKVIKCTRPSLLSFCTWTWESTLCGLTLLKFLNHIWNTTALHIVPKMSNLLFILIACYIAQICFKNCLY